MDGTRKRADRFATLEWASFLVLYALLTAWIILGRQLVPEIVFTRVKNGGYLGVMLVGLWLFRAALARSWRSTTKAPIASLGLVALGLALMAAASGASQVATVIAGSASAGENQALISAEVTAASTSVVGSIVFIIVGGVAAPVVEEIVFREIPFGRLRERLSTRAALISTIVVFTAIHLRSWDEWPLIFLYAGYAAALATVYLLSRRNLLVCMATHILWNSTGLVFLFVAAA